MCIRDSYPRAWKADVAKLAAENVGLIWSAGSVLDDFEARYANTLAPFASMKDGPVRILVTAGIGTTRLIDNVAV